MLEQPDQPLAEVVSDGELWNAVAVDVVGGHAAQAHSCPGPGVAEKAGYRPVLATNRRFTGQGEKIGSFIESLGFGPRRGNSSSVDPKWNGLGESGSWDVASFAFNWRRTPLAELVA